MTARTPEQVQPLFEEAFNAGDIDALMTLYEPGASIEPEPGQLVEGADGVREVLKSFLALKGAFTFETKKVVQTGDLALLHGHWTLAGTGPDGSPVDLSGDTTEVVRRQSDGSWLYVIDLADDA